MPGNWRLLSGGRVHLVVDLLYLTVCTVNIALYATAINSSFPVCVLRSTPCSAEQMQGMQGTVHKKASVLSRRRCLHSTLLVTTLLHGVKQPFKSVLFGFVSRGRRRDIADFDNVTDHVEWVILFEVGLPAFQNGLVDVCRLGQFDPVEVVVYDALRVVLEVVRPLHNVEKLVCFTKCHAFVDATVLQHDLSHE